MHLRRGMVLLLLLLSGHVWAQTLTEWVDARPRNALGMIALGYPVPIPVDTPLPFDGFRTYAGLHMRHQDLAASTDYVHPEEIGTTQAGRTIWAYRLGDFDKLTIDGLPEPATLTNGGIHAREWQSPEVVTGILELMASHENDHHFYDYLRGNVNMVVIPSLNIDGFLQTQRTPTLNYMDIDPNYPSTSPRDGRMRRKNMSGADEDLLTTADILNGVDLNRNNEPYWNTSANGSSRDLVSIVHHGAGPQSEGETQALDVAAELGPVDRLRIYTDVHSFSMVHFWGVNDDFRLAFQTEKVLQTFTDHHQAFPSGKWYRYADRYNVPKNQGIGTTDEYFTNIYQVPSWTLEVEPSNGASYHAPLPGSGADYGGLSENGHDGFILPESEIRRVREELAQSFAAVYYRQAGPPNVQALKIVDSATDAIVYEAEWNVVDAETRELYQNQLQPLALDRNYEFWLSFNKPMRWRENGEVVPFPGQPESGLDLDADIEVNSVSINANVEAADWLNEPGGAPDGYMNYQDDSIRVSMQFPKDQSNIDLVAGGVDATLRLQTSDLTGMRTDAKPGTVANWEDGSWVAYENSNGFDTDLGGYDASLSFQISDQAATEPFVIEPGISSSWYDPSHEGEGFLIEILANDIALMFWYTFNADGEQAWYVATGKVSGNHIEFSQIYQSTGGEFGPNYDPDDITQMVVGSASFIWSDCDSGSMSYRIGTQHGRMQLNRITNLMGLPCVAGQPVPTSLPPISERALLSGSWYDPTHDGEGFNIEVLDNGLVLVYWFSYDLEGNPRWFFGIGEDRNGKIVIEDLLTTSGGIFGADFDPATVVLSSWGTLELDIDCNGGTASYSSTEPGFGDGELNIVKLTNITGGIECIADP